MSYYATTIATDDLPRLRSFYERLLGVEAVSNGDVYCEFRTPAGTLALVYAGTHPAAPEVAPGSNRSVEITLSVPDVSEAFARLEGDVDGWTVPPAERWWGWRTGMVRDTDGNLVSIGTPAPWAQSVEVEDWHDAPLAGVLRRQVRDAWWFVRNAVRDLTDAEFFRELAPESWAVRRREDATTPMASGAGDWVIDYAAPAPDPAPFTTIGWRLVHIGATVWVAWDGAFGEAKLWYDSIEVPSTADGAVSWWAEGAGRFSRDLGAVTDEDLRRSAGGRDASLHDRVVRVVRETTHHAAEIACLRDVYRALDPG